MRAWARGWVRVRGRGGVGAGVTMFSRVNRGPTDDAGLSRLNSNPIGATLRPLDLAVVERRSFDILPLGELAKLPKKSKKVCEGIRSCQAVTIVRGTVPRVVQTSEGRRAPEQTRPAGTQASRASRHPSEQDRLAPTDPLASVRFHSVQLFACMFSVFR